MALIQTVNPAVSTGTITASLTNTKVGNLILVFVGSSALTDTVSTVTDNAGNTYSKAYSVATGSGGDTELWYTGNAKPTTSVVTTFSASVSTKSVFVREYSSMSKSPSVFDQKITTSGSGTAVSTGASPSTTSANELIVCSTSCLGTSPTLVVGGSFGNFTSQAVTASASIHAICDLSVTSIGTQTGLMTAGGTLPLWDVGLATFIQVAGAGDILNRHVFADSGMSTSEVAN